MELNGCVRVDVKVCCVDIHWECCVLWAGWFMLVSGIYGAEWILMEVALLWRFGLALQRTSTYTTTLNYASPNAPKSLYKHHPQPLTCPISTQSTL